MLRRSELMPALGVEKANVAVSQDDIAGQGLAGLADEIAASVSAVAAALVDKHDASLPLFLSTAVHVMSLMFLGLAQQRDRCASFDDSDASSSLGVWGTYLISGPGNAEDNISAGDLALKMASDLPETLEPLIAEAVLPLLEFFHGQAAVTHVFEYLFHQDAGLSAHELSSMLSTHTTDAASPHTRTRIYQLCSSLQLFMLLGVGGGQSRDLRALEREAERSAAEEEEEQEGEDESFLDEDDETAGVLNPESPRFSNESSATWVPPITLLLHPG
ncbi:hypothetical protein T484DRAFT_1891065 [Baffinella frigidus]|nr:hypothetical protein T484DRAFT_1891065 [Cryptophyta sp. CCMP2293]